MTERPENNSPVLRDREAAGNATMYYTLWTVFKRSVPAERGQGAAEFETLVQELADQGVSVRGLYDVSAMRQDADVMVWI
ncbi:chlorite dismutase, partial [Glutamicibacter creatinolyticus]